jgi:trehalose 6-phosphate synthase
MHALADRGLEPGGRAEVFPLGPDPETLAAERTRPEVTEERTLLEERLDGRRALVRVDRAEPSKNVLRGLAAFGELLATRPDLVGDVVHLVLLNPSRQTLPAYRTYLEECLTAADELNARAGREVTIVYAEDRYPRSIAALALADVIVVNPISDGMNLVAKEGPLVNELDAPLILSTEAGAHTELAGSALSVNPYDVTATAREMARALGMSAEERAVRAAAMRRAAAAHPPQAWLQAQLDSLAVAR